MENQGIEIVIFTNIELDYDETYFLQAMQTTSRKAVLTHKATQITSLDSLQDKMRGHLRRMDMQTFSLLSHQHKPQP